MLTTKQQILVLLEEVAAQFVQPRMSTGAALRTLNWAIRGVRQLPETEDDQPKFYESKFELKWSQCWRAKVETLKRQVTCSQEALDAKIDECNKLAAVVSRLQARVRASWGGATADVTACEWQAQAETVAALRSTVAALRSEIERLTTLCQRRTSERDAFLAERNAATVKGTETFHELAKYKKTLALLGQTLKDLEQ